MDVAVMDFHLLAEIAESKTCSRDSLTPPPFYNQFYSQYHRTQRTSKWRIGAANKALHCLACHSNFLGRSKTRDTIYSRCTTQQNRTILSPGVRYPDYVVLHMRV